MEGNTDYYINPHTQQQTDAHGCKRECNLAPRFESFLNCSARMWTCSLVRSQAGRSDQTWKRVGRLLPRAVRLCAQVFIVRITRQYMCWGPAIEMGLHVYPSGNISGISRIFFLSLLNIVPPLLPPSRWQRRWFILLRQRTSVTRVWTHLHTHTLARTHAYTRAPRSAVIHLSLIPTCQPAPPTVSAPRKVTAFQWLTKAL